MGAAEACGTAQLETCPAAAAWQAALHGETRKRSVVAGSVCAPAAEQNPASKRRIFMDAFLDDSGAPPQLDSASAGRRAPASLQFIVWSNFSA
jgi:hypothetical protein